MHCVYKDLFDRLPDNPIITTNDIPYPANSVLNAGAAKVKGEYLLLLRVEDRTGISHLTTARSKDGFKDWKISKRPVLEPNLEHHPEEVWGIEDPRITYVDEEKRWFVAYTAYSKGGPSFL